MFKDEKAVNDVRRKVAEKLKQDGDKLIFGWRGESEPTRKEGDVWEDISGKKWTIKNGVRQSVTKLDDAKTPWWCPRCTKPMNHRLDIKFWRIRGHCMDCVIKDESELRRSGKWEEYERKLMLRNYVAEITDKIAQLQAYHDEVSKPEFLIMNENEKTVLMMEEWDIDIDKLKTDLQNDIEELRSILKETIEKYGKGEHDGQQVTEVPNRDETVG